MTVGAGPSKDGALRNRSSGSFEGATLRGERATGPIEEYLVRENPWLQLQGTATRRPPSVRQPTQRRSARQETQVPPRTGPAFSASPCGDGP